VLVNLQNSDDLISALSRDKEGILNCLAEQIIEKSKGLVKDLYILVLLGLP
jgi:hypothetical protein